MIEQRIHITDELFAPVIPRLAAAIQWLQSDQPKEAIMSHHGMYLPAENCVCGLRISLAPVAWHNRPVFIFDKSFVGEGTPHLRQDLYYGSEINVIKRGIKAAGGEIQLGWNGRNCTSASFALTVFAGEPVANLVSNYREHMSQYGFCWPPGLNANYGLVIKPEGWQGS